MNGWTHGLAKLGGCLVIVAATSLVPLQAGNPLLGDRVTVKEAGRVTVDSARIEWGQDILILAGRADYVADGPRGPRVMDLSGGVGWSDGSAVFDADTATYYPEAGFLLAPALVRSVDPGGTTEYTCRNGTRNANGVPVEGNTACVGRMELSCGGPGGNQVVVHFRVEECPVN